LRFIHIRNLTAGSVTLTVGVSVSIFPTGGTGTTNTWPMPTNTAQGFYAPDATNWIGF
jgi:hypothetical protein